MTTSVSKKKAPAAKNKAVPKRSPAAKAPKPKGAPKPPKKRAPPSKPASYAPAKETRVAVKRPIAASLPRPSRRAVFVDVENTSSEVDLLRVLESIPIDRSVQTTELTAVGNWRTVGQRLGRRLAMLGAQLVHSAPATGVRDWSDLWIAVAAGCWLGTAAPGDVLDIVSDDRAFDAVGDAAAARGVIFRRLSHRTARPVAEPGETAAEPGHRHSRRGRRRRPGAPYPRVETPASAAAGVGELQPKAESSARAAHDEAHAASHAQITAVLTRLTGGNAERWVNLDVLANALKSEGFTRPPGSLRLVTRLRKLKDVEVSPNGMVRLAQSQTSPATPDEASSALPTARRRSRRRGGRGRSRAKALGGDADLNQEEGLRESP